MIVKKDASLAATPIVFHWLGVKKDVFGSSIAQRLWAKTRENPEEK
jgi:hypothetical protein